MNKTALEHYKTVANVIAGVTVIQQVILTAVL